MSGKKKKSSNVLLISIAVSLLFMVGIGLVMFYFLGEDDGSKRRVQQITLLKPPPPPKMKEKPPEPEVKKEEEIIEQEKLEELPEMEEVSGEPPASDQLGLDAEGAAGSDAFGLAARRGGRSLIGGDGGARFAWYTGKVAKEIQDMVNEILRQQGKLPKKSVKAKIRIVLDSSGRVVESNIVNSSGNNEMDQAIRQALGVAQMQEPPPHDMPRALWFEISSQG